MAHGLILRVRHYGKRPNNILLADIKDAIGDIHGWNKPGPVYVPVGGYIDIVYTTTVAKSLDGGYIQTLLQQGEIGVDFLLGDELSTTQNSGGQMWESDDYIVNLGPLLYTDTLVGGSSITQPLTSQNGTILLSSPLGADQADRATTEAFIRLELNPTFIARARITGPAVPTNVLYGLGIRLPPPLLGGMGFTVLWPTTGNDQWNAVATFAVPPGPNPLVAVDGNWHTFMFKATPTEVRYFYDGLLLLTRDITGTFPPNTPFTIINQCYNLFGAALAEVEVDYWAVQQNRT